MKYVGFSVHLYCTSKVEYCFLFTVLDADIVHYFQMLQDFHQDVVKHATELMHV